MTVPSLHGEGTRCNGRKSAQLLVPAPVVEEMLGAPLSPGCPSADHQPCWRDVSPSPTGALARMQPTLPSAWDVGMRVIAVPDQCRRSQWGCGTWGASSIQGRWRQQPERGTVLGSASLLVRGVGEQLNGGEGFPFTISLFVSAAELRALPGSVVWFGRLPGSPWMWLCW